MGPKKLSSFNNILFSIVIFCLFSLFPSLSQSIAYAIDFVTNTDSLNVPEGDTATFNVKLSSQPFFRIDVTVTRISGDDDIDVEKGASLRFTRSNWNKFQKVTLSAEEDSDSANGTAEIRISSLFITDKIISAIESDNDEGITFVTDTDTVSVPEGGSTAFQVKLSANPQSIINANVSRISGDNDITVQSGSDLTFDSINWDIYQIVTLAATEDSDSSNGSATFRIAAQGISSKEIIATEGDDETINVLNPNGGEIWPVDTTQEITWTSGGITSSSVSIDLLNGGQPDRTIIPSTPNDGSFTWDIPSDLSGSLEHRIRITSTSDLTITDESDGNFTIAGAELDSDGDGVPDMDEMGPGRSNPGYDGNDDLMPDRQQYNVASLPTFDESHYVTFECAHILDFIQAIEPPPGGPEDTSFPYGFFEFSISGLAEGGATIATLYLDSEVPNTYYKIGATPEFPTPAWYEFSFDPDTGTGAEMDGFIVDLYFVDGNRGDDDLLPDGIIVDQGGPGALPPEPTGKDCFIATAAFGSIDAPYVRLLRQFRDTYLLKNVVGKWFVKQYYRYSPPVAIGLAKHETLKAGVRLLLVPLVVLAWFLLKPVLTIPTLALTSLCSFTIYAALRSKYLLFRGKR